MKMLRQFVLILAVLLPLVVPTMVCTLPNAHLSPTERACCRQMSGQCEGGAMTACQGCCDWQVPTASNWNAAVQPNLANAQMDLSAVTESTPAVLPLLPIVLSDYGQWLETALPQSSPPAFTFLRI